MSYKRLLYLVNQLDNISSELVINEDSTLPCAYDPSNQHLIDTEMEEIRSEIKDIVDKW